MAVKVRKQIYIERYQEVLLKRIAQRTGVSEAEIIRQAIDRHVRSLQSPGTELTAWEVEDEFIGALIEQGPVAGGRTWQREVLYER